MLQDEARAFEAAARAYSVFREYSNNRTKIGIMGIIHAMRPFKHPAVEDLSLERLFHALSDPVRLDIVRTLARTAEATCSELDGGRPKSSMSHHFRVLRDAGLVCTRHAGTTHINTLRRAELDARWPGLLAAVVQASGERRA